MCSGRKKSDAKAEALDRSKGGFSWKIHALTDALVYPLRFILTAGQASDRGQAEALARSIPLKRLIADKSMIQKLLWNTWKHNEALITSKSNALEARKCDWIAYKERHVIEGVFGKMKHYRCVFSRFEKKAQNFLGFLAFVAVLIWTR